MAPVLVAALGTGVDAAACADNSGCFGGVCNSGSCVCPPSWNGTNCEILRLRPARAAAPGLALWMNTSTWGGGAVQHTDGSWHLFVAYMAANCGLNAWWPNSEVVHARSTGDGPDGPYEVARTVLPDFAHGPKVHRLRDGTLALLHIGCGDLSTPAVSGCTNGTTPYNWTHAKNRSRCNQPGWTGILRASTVDGPWQQTEDQAASRLSVDGGADSWHRNGGLTNPSLWRYNESGSEVVLAYSEGCDKCVPDAGHKHIGVAIGTLGNASGSADKFKDLTPGKPIFPWASEDPTIFRDPDSGYWHILAHRTSSTAGGGPDGNAVASHAVAADPRGPWTIVPSPPYGRDIAWDDGSVTHVQKRERPQIIVDRNGTLVGLSNGVRPGNTATPISPGYTWDWTYTHIQLIDRQSSQ